MWEKINSILASLAEAYADTSASTFMWGEEEMPECLMEQEDESKE